MTTISDGLKGDIRHMREERKMEYAQIATALNRQKVKTPMGKRWSAENVRLKYHNDRRRRASAAKQVRAQQRATGVPARKILPEAVRRIVSLYEAGKLSWSEIVSTLEAEGIKTATGVPWSVHNARKIYDQRDQLLAQEGEGNDKSLVYVGDKMNDVNAALAAADQQEELLRGTAKKLFAELEAQIGHPVHVVARKGGKIFVSYEATMIFDEAGAPTASAEAFQ